MEQSLVDPYKDLHVKYNVTGSYYTAYPPSGLWSEQFGDPDYRRALAGILTEKPRLPLQLYLHFPYCVKQCYYCQCFQLVTKDQQRLTEMVDALVGEIAMLRDLFAQSGVTPLFKEIHLGGGSPSYLEMDQFDRLVEAISSIAAPHDVEEFAIEIDPRTVTPEKLRHYSARGINRISFGVQELDPEIQKAINRVQPIEQIEDLLKLRGLFKGVNFDLLYGLPLQTRASLRKTLEKVILLSPDRIAFSVLGYRPDVFKHNQKIPASDLPKFLERTNMWEESLRFFLANGYERIGMDHFAKPGDELASAKREDRLFRNSMGYSPGRFQDNLSVGPSAMTRISDRYFQNSYSIPEYCGSIARKEFPVIRGHALDQDALIRRSIMNELMTYYRLDIRALERTYQIVFRDYFATELVSLREFTDSELLEITPSAFTVPELGRFFLRNICMVFDNLGLDYKHNIETGIARKG